MIPKLLLVACCLASPTQLGAFVPRPSKQGAGATHTIASQNRGGTYSSSSSSSSGGSTSRSHYGPRSSKARSNRRRRPSPLASTATVIDGPSDVEMDTQSNSASVVDDENLEDTLNVASDPIYGGSPKEELINLVTGGFLDSSSPMKRASVNELLLRLEALNPTPIPAYSPLLNGAWEFLWTGGISPGVLGLQLASRLSSYASGAVEVGETTLTISRAQPRVEVKTSIKVFGRENAITIRTNLEPATELRLDETYTEASMGSLRVPFPDQKQLFRRPLFISYLDNDLLVVRDSFGAPDVLVRKDKAFVSNTGVPSATDDDTSPGAG